MGKFMELASPTFNHTRASGFGKFEIAFIRRIIMLFRSIYYLEQP
jgi:hypothetical protein